jgi:hypothetical protein
VPAQASRERVTRVEKLNSSNALHRKPGSPDSDSPRNCGSRAQARASRFDTEESASLWNGPRLRAAFVAQVLGQVFAGAESQTTQPATYRRTQIPTGLLHDEMA